MMIIIRDKLKLFHRCIQPLHLSMIMIKVINQYFYDGNHEQGISIIPQIVTKNSIIRNLL